MVGLDEESTCKERGDGSLEMYRDRIYARFTTKATSLSWTRHGGTIGRSRAAETPTGRGLEPRAQSTVASF